jgi:hypothetical protein
VSVKSAYATGAQTVGKALSRAGLMGGRPPGRDRRFRHWLYSLPRIHDSIAIAELDVPWWTYRAIDVVDAWLSAKPAPVRVFEFGAGASTAWLIRRTDEVHSVEHHRGFADSIRPMLTEAGGADLIVVEPTKSARPRVPSRKPGYADADFTDYVAAIDGVGGLFDVIVIDGRARSACLVAAVPHLKDDGIIIFDNSRRARYRPAIEASGLREQKFGGLTPTLPYPDRTSLLTHP